MKFIAIIIASIAALAATGQAYLIWKQQDKLFQVRKEWTELVVFRDYDAPHYKRAQICSSLMKSFAEFSVLIAGEDEMVAEWAHIRALELERRQDRIYTTTELRNEEGLRRAENQLVREFTLSLQSVMKFQQVNKIYFTDLEIGKMNFDVVSNLPAVVKINRVRQNLSAESMNRVGPVIGELLQEADSMKSVCTSVLLEGIE